MSSPAPPVRFSTSAPIEIGLARRTIVRDAVERRRSRPGGVIRVRHRVDVRTTDQRVGVRTTRQRVVARTAIERVGPDTTGQRVLPDPTGQGVVAVTTAEGVVPVGATGDRVVPGATGDRVVPGTTVERVVPTTAVEGVRAARCLQVRVRETTEELVRPESPVSESLNALPVRFSTSVPMRSPSPGEPSLRSPSSVAVTAAL